MLKLKEFILNNKDWEEKLTSSPYNLIIKKDGPYILFKYNQLSSDFNIDLVREARGIIFREDKWECVCHPFNKFGNYGESYCSKIDWNSVSVQEKIDGSLIKIWFDQGWHISTNGTIDAFKAELSNCDKFKSYGDLVKLAVENVGLTLNDLFFNLSPCCTYMFELVSPYSKVVIPYDNTELYFLGLREMLVDEELDIDKSLICDYIKQYFKIPKRYNLKTLKDVKDAADKLSWNEEGYVVCDKNFNRVKVKSPKYVKAHFISGGVVTNERLMEIILNHEEDEFLIYSSKYESTIHDLKKCMNEFKEQILVNLDYIESVNKPKDRKEFANIVNLNYPSYIRPFLFAGKERLQQTLDNLSEKRYIEILNNYKEDKECHY